MALVILFLLALVLAWPTGGLSIIAFIALVAFRAYLKAKTRMHHANRLGAERSMAAGEKRLPSWCRDREKALVFLEAIQQGAMRQGVPRKFLQGVLANLDTTNDMFHFAGAIEHEGGSFLEQQMVIVEKLVATWNKTSDRGRKEIMNSY